jgi:cyclic pyranopterin phosphate synthase
MPQDGIALASHEEILSYEEILRLVRIFAGLGIQKIKLTGGEPLVRRGIEALVSGLCRVPGISQVTITTNGILLASKMEALAGAGIAGINLSLDTMDPKTFTQITGYPALAQVMEGLRVALDYPQIPMKINCVPLGIPGQDVTEMAELARKYPVQVRYIEMMPIGAGTQFEGVREDDLLEMLAKKYGAYQPYDGQLGNGPGHYYTFPGFCGRVGFISAVSHRFCDSCNRVRLTSQGFLKTCLQYDTGADLRALLRGGASDEALKQAIRDAVAEKPAGHQFGCQIESHSETRLMSQIGG